MMRASFGNLTSQLRDGMTNIHEILVGKKSNCSELIVEGFYGRLKAVRENIMSYRGMMDGWNGDEDELESELNCQREAYEDEHADDWKYDFDEE